MLSDKISIVIPCKNEGINIYDCIGLLAKQKHVENVDVIISDVSDEKESLEWLNRAISDFEYKLNIQIIRGGYPAEGRLKGSRLVKTPYIIFLDSDVMLSNDKTLINCYKTILSEKKCLLTIPFKTEHGWNWAFRMFDFSQWISRVIGTPFAIGGFQFWKTEEYWETGGYVVDHKFAEDYWVSSKCDSNKFIVYRGVKAWTSARRFKMKGIRYMIWIMWKSYLNRNNEEFFKYHHNYWN